MEVAYKIHNKTLLTFTDELLDSNNLGTFKRTIKNQTFYFERGQLKYKEKVYTFPIIKKLNPKPYLINKFITMDLETLSIDGKLSPYAVSTYDGKEYNFFYLSANKNSDELLIDSIKSLMIRKYHGYKVYLHNFSNFDSIFILKILSKISLGIIPIINDNDLINLTVYFSKNYNIKFKDSYLLLPSSLKKLAKNFNVEEKGIYPYRFVNNINIPLDYVGKVPSFKYFDGISEKEYDLYSQSYNND